MPYKKRDSWYISYVDSSTHKRVNEATQCRTKTEAGNLEQELRVKHQRVRSGLDKAASVNADTVGELAKWWLKQTKSLAGASQNVYAVTRHIIEHPINELRAAELRPAQVEVYLRGKRDEGFHPETCNHLRRFLSRIFSLAIKLGRFDGDNPLSKVSSQKVPKRKRDFPLRLEQMPSLFANLPEGMVPLFATAVFTGLRKGELFGLQKTDVDLSRRLITVRRSHGRDVTKGGDDGTVPIVEELVPFLEVALKTSGVSRLVFPAADGGRRRSDGDLSSILRTALARAGFVECYMHKCRRKNCGHEEQHPNDAVRRCPSCNMKLWPRAKTLPLRFHDLRHARATFWLSAGVPLSVVQKHMRHSDPRITAEVYGHIAEERLAEYANSVTLGISPAVTTRRLPATAQRDIAAELAAANSRNHVGKLVESRGIEPLTSGLQSGFEQLVGASKASQVLENKGLAINEDSHDPEPVADFCSLDTTRRLPENDVALLTVRDVAELLGVSAAMVYRLVETGQLRHLRILNAIRVRVADLQAFYDGQASLSERKA